MNGEPRWTMLDLAPLLFLAVTLLIIYVARGM